MDTTRRPSAKVVTLEQAASLGPPPPGNLATPVFGHGSLEVEWYAPAHEDRQQPHDRDEVYVVARGNAVFFDGEQRTRVAEGAFIFVAAGREHRFEELSVDFAVWVLFYGPSMPALRSSSTISVADSSAGFASVSM